MHGLTLTQLPTADKLIAAMPQVPPTARVLARLQHLLADPNSSLDDIATLLKLDASLVTRIVAVSNSILYNRGRTCADIEESVNRLGFREIHRIVAVLASKAIVAGALPAYGKSGDDAWRESVACALSAEIIAERLGEDSAAAYTAGLLHGIGRQPISLFLSGVDKSKVLNSAGFPTGYSSAEYAILGFHNAEVAARMLQKWDFSKAIVEAVRAQYSPLAAHEPYDRMASILFTARLLLAISLDGEQPVEGAEETEILTELRITREDLKEMIPALARGLDRAIRITQTGPSKTAMSLF